MRASELLTESISGTDMLRIYKATHHGADSNPQMERWIERHDWGIKMLRPEQIPDENDPVYFNDPFGRVQDLDPERVRYFRIKLRNRAPVKPIIKGPGRSIIDGNHRAQAAKQLNMSIQAYVPMNVVSEGRQGVTESIEDTGEFSTNIVQREMQDVWYMMYPKTRLYTGDSFDNNPVFASTKRQYVKDQDYYNGLPDPKGHFYLQLSAGYELPNLTINVLDANAGKFKGVVVKMLDAIYKSMEKSFASRGISTQRVLTVGDDASGGAWEHIAQKLGANSDLHRSHLYKKLVSSDGDELTGSKPGVAEGSEQDYLSQIPNLTWKPVNRKVWNTIQDEGLDEEQDTPNHSDWLMASLSISPKDAQALQAFDDDTIENFNRFDIHLKSRYPGFTDLIDYDRGTVTIVKTAKKQGVVENFADGQVKDLRRKNKSPNNRIVAAITKAVPNAQEIWFHGSRAIGKHRPNSDIDILVVVPEELSAHDYIDTVDVLHQVSKNFSNYDIQPTKPGYNIHRIAQEEGKLLWSNVKENFADGQIKGRSRPGRVRRAGASCKGSVTALRAKAKKYGGEKGKMIHWCANMKAGKKR